MNTAGNFSAANTFRSEGKLAYVNPEFQAALLSRLGLTREELGISATNAVPAEALQPNPPVP